MFLNFAHFWNQKKKGKRPINFLILRVNGWVKVKVKKLLLHGAQ